MVTWALGDVDLGDLRPRATLPFGDLDLVGTSRLEKHLIFGDLDSDVDDFDSGGL